MTDVLTAIANRSSTRGYTADKLSQDQLDALLRAGLQKSHPGGRLIPVGESCNPPRPHTVNL